MDSGYGDVVLASGVVEAAAEAGEGGQTEAGFDDASDDVGGLGRLVGIPVVGDGFSDAAEFDDGEFASEFALEGVDATADFGEGHGVASGLSESGPVSKHGVTIYGISGSAGLGGMAGFLDFPLISAHFRSFE